MARERGEPAIADTSKPILEAPVYPNFPENTPKPRKPSEDPDLLRKNDSENHEDDARATDID